MFVDELIEFGLSEKEARIYLALLEVEVGTVQEVAAKADVNRSSAYVVLDSLTNRGLVSVSEDNAIQRFVAAPPERLVRIAEHAAEEQLRLRHKINAILPDLKSLYKGVKQKPRMRLFDGEEGLISALEETLNTKEKIVRMVFSAPVTKNALTDYLPIYAKKRTRLGISMRGICTNESETQKLAQECCSQPSDELAILPNDKSDTIADLIIHDSTTLHISVNDLSTISIEDKAIAQGMKKVFDLAFAMAHSLPAKSSRRIRKTSRR